VFRKKTLYQEPTILQLEARFAKQSKNQRQRLSELLRSGELDIEGDSAEDIILLIILNTSFIKEIRVTIL